MNSFHVTDADGDVAVAPRIRYPSLKVHCIAGLVGGRSAPHGSTLADLRPHR